MDLFLIDGAPLDARALATLARGSSRFALTPEALGRLRRDRAVVEAHIAADVPVYGLNTGLGGNLGYRLGSTEVQAWQARIIQGRMIGMGEPMAADAVRASLLARAGLQPVQLEAKDGLGLINSSALTVGNAAVVSETPADTLRVAALADEGYAANPTVFDVRIAALRPASGQARMAAVFRALLAGGSLYGGTPRSPGGGRRAAHHQAPDATPERAAQVPLARRGRQRGLQRTAKDRCRAVCRDPPQGHARQPGCGGGVRHGARPRHAGAAVRAQAG